MVPNNTCYGFWIDPISKEFKILVLQRLLRTLVRWNLYSSIRRDWRVIPTENLGTWKSLKGPPVMIGDVAHCGGSMGEVKVILSFDFVQESFDVIRLPARIYSKIAVCRWQGMLSLVCWNENFIGGCKIYLRQEGSWVKKCSLKVYESIQRVFWAMEDVEERNKKGKRKREMEESITASKGGKDASVRILATIVKDISIMEGELVFDGPKTGCKTLRKGLDRCDTVNMAYDFVESLLFPEL